MPDSGSTDPSYQLNARLLRYRSRPGSEEPLALIDDLLAASRYGDARGVAVLEQTANPEDVRFVVLEGRAWFLERDLARAQAVLLRGLKVAPQAAEVFRWLAEVLFARGDHDRAIKAVERGLGVDATHTELLRLQARVTRAAEAAPVAGLVIDVPAEPSAPPLRVDTSERPTAAPPRPRPIVTPPAASPAAAAPPPAAPSAPAVPVAPPAPVFTAASRAPDRAAMPNRSVTPPKPRPAAQAELRARDNTLQGLFGAGAKPPTGMPVAERRSGGTLPFPSSVPTPAPVSAPKGSAAPVATMRPPPGRGVGKGTTPGLLETPLHVPEDTVSLRPSRKPRESVGESLEPVEFAPRARASMPSRHEATVPGLVESPVAVSIRGGRGEFDSPARPAEAPSHVAPSNSLPWDDDQFDEQPTGEHNVADDAPTFDARASATLPMPTGPVPKAAPDVVLGADAGGTEDVEAMLDMLRRQGIFEPPTGTTTAWADRKDVPRAGTKLTTVLAVVWALTLLLSVGGYFGWQQYVLQRHAEAGVLVAKARTAIATGDHLALIEAEQQLRAAHEAYPLSSDVVEAQLLLHSVRALEDGTGDVSALRTTLAGAATIVSRLKELGEKKTVSPAYLAAARATASALGGEIPLARTGMEEALAAAGQDFTLRYWVGRTAQRIGEPIALDGLTAAVEGAPALFAASLALAELEREAGQQAEALARVEGVLAKSSGHLRARLWRAYLQADQEAPDTALAGLDAMTKEVAQGAPTDRLLETMTRARLLRRSGKMDEAGTLVSSGLSLGATDPRLLALVAQEAQRAGKYGVAQMAATQAVTGAPAVASYRRLLAEVLIDRQDGARALTVLEQLSNDDPEVLVMRARAALLLGTPEALSQVSEALDAYVQATPAASIRVRALRIRARVQLEATPAVLKEAEKLSKEAHGDADALLALGEAALELRQGSAADRALTALIKVAPEMVRAYYLLGRVKRLNGDADGAEANLRKTLELASNHTEALMALGSLLLDRAKYAEADALYQELATRSGEAHLGRLGRVESLVGLGQLDDAQVQWEGVAEKFRDTPTARQIGARLALAQGKPGEALTLLRPLTEGEGVRATSLALYGDALYAADQVDAAAGAYDGAIALDAGLPEALIGRGMVEVRAEKPDDALEHLAAAKAALAERIRPPELMARMWLLTGRAYIQRDKRGDMETARTALTAATAIERVDPSAFFWLGESWAGRNTPEARAAYERYLALRPVGEFVARARKALLAR